MCETELGCGTEGGRKCFKNIATSLRFRKLGPSYLLRRTLPESESAQNSLSYFSCMRELSSMNSEYAFGGNSSMPPAKLMLSLDGKMLRMSEGEIRACGTADGRKTQFPSGVNVCTSTQGSRCCLDREAGKNNTIEGGRHQHCRIRVPTSWQYALRTTITWR